MDAVNLSFRYSENDYVRALRAHYASRLHLPLDVAVGVGLAAIGAYLWRSGSPYGVAFTCIAGVFALILIAAFAIIPHVAFRREPKFRDDYSLTFSAQGIHFQTAHINSELQWSLYSRALVDEHSFVLYYGTQSFTVIPKRVFQTAVQRETFERLLAQNVPQVIDKRK